MEYLPLGENVALTVAVNGPGRPPLFLTVPAHTARRNEIAQGVEIGVSLLAEGIHLMPADEIRTPAKPA
jgi:molybdate transport system ATP-binding protein